MTRFCKLYLIESDLCTCYNFVDFPFLRTVVIFPLGDSFGIFFSYHMFILRWNIFSHNSYPPNFISSMCKPSVAESLLLQLLFMNSSTFLLLKTTSASDPFSYFYVSCICRFYSAGEFSFLLPCSISINV